MIPPWVPADCFACKRCASLGIGKTKIQSICWECAQVAEELRLMKRPALDLIEKNALVAAGDAGSQFLDGGWAKPGPRRVGAPGITPNMCALLF